MFIDKIIISAKELNNAKSIAECRLIAEKAISDCSEETLEYLGGISEYYDTVITIFVMAINRSLSFSMDIDESSKDFYDLVDKNSADAESSFRALVEKLDKNSNMEDYAEFCAYLEKLIKYIFMSYNDHLVLNTKNKYISSWEQWDREDDLRDYMTNLIRPNKWTTLNEFTKKHGIQIPYLYAYVNELQNVINHSKYINYSERQERYPEYDGKYTSTMISWLKIYTQKIREHLLFTIMNVTEPEPDSDSALIYTEVDENHKRGIWEREMVSFIKLLPSIEYSIDKANTHEDVYYNNYRGDLDDMEDARKAIVPKAYCSLPLIPHRIEKNTSMNKYAAFLKSVLEYDVEMEKTTVELEEKKQIADNAVKEKDKLMSEFAHTYGNMSAESLGAIANKLLKSDDPEIRKLGRQTMMECSIKNDLTRAVYMLRLKFNNNRQELRNIVCKGISFKKREGYDNILKVADDALQRVVIRMFYDMSGDEKVEVGQDNFCEALGVQALNDVVEEFEDAVFSKNVSVMEWLKSKGIALDVTVDDSFSRMFFKSNSRSCFFFKDLISECFFNIMKYAVLTESLTIRFTSDKTHYIMEFKNTNSEMAAEYSNGEGLESKKMVMNMLNENEKENDSDKGNNTINNIGRSDFKWTNEDGIFTAKILLSKDIISETKI